MRGRKPKPTWLKVIADNPGHREINEDEPQPTGDLAAPPDWFNEEQVETWNKAIARAPLGLLRELDESVLAVWVVAACLHRDAAKRVAKAGSIVKSKSSGYPMQNPYLAIINKQASIMLKASAEMGFTPSARSRVRVEKPKAGKRNAFDGFDDLQDVNDA